MKPEGVRARKARETRVSLIASARAVFAEVGYAEASLDEIVGRAGVTKGALYHHFGDKLQLYATVVEQLARELVELIETAADDAQDPWGRVEAMCDAYLDACLGSDVQRVLVIEAPATLGWRVWCQVEKDNNVGALARCLDAAMQAGVVAPQPSENLARLIYGTLNTAARVIVESDQPEAARGAVGDSVARLLGGLRNPTD